MSSEPIDRKIEFIIEQQAAFSVKMDQLQERQAAFQESQAAFQESQAAFLGSQSAFQESLVALRDQDAINSENIATLNDLALSLFKLISDQGLRVSDDEAYISHLSHNIHRHDLELDSVREAAEKQDRSIDEIRQGYLEIRKQIAALEEKMRDKQS